MCAHREHRESFGSGALTKGAPRRNGSARQRQVHSSRARKMNLNCSAGKEKSCRAARGRKRVKKRSKKQQQQQPRSASPPPPHLESLRFARIYAYTRARLAEHKLRCCCSIIESREEGAAAAPPAECICKACARASFILQAAASASVILLHAASPAHLLFLSRLFREYSRANAFPARACKKIYN